MISAHSIKMTMQKARRRISAFQKAFKQGKLNKKSYEKLISCKKFIYYIYKHKTNSDKLRYFVK